MCIGSIFIGFAYYISFLYGIVFAIEEKGYSLSDGALFMTIIGASDTISRLILSHFTEGTKKWRFAGFTASIFLLFIMFVFLPFLCDWFESSTLWILYSFYALFGIFYSTLECLEPVISADIVSLGNFSRAYGLYITFQSLGYISSSWIASDLQNSFGVNSVLIFIGSMFAISGALMIYAECLDIHHHHHHQKPETSQSQLSIQLNTLES
jgi:predicted MFS family arabinose efflux permease